MAANIDASLNLLTNSTFKLLTLSYTRAGRLTWRCAATCCQRSATRTRCWARTSTAGASKTLCPWANSSRPHTRARAASRTRSTRAMASPSSTHSPSWARALWRRSRATLAARRPQATHRPVVTADTCIVVTKKLANAIGHCTFLLSTHNLVRVFTEMSCV